MDVRWQKLYVVAQDEAHDNGRIIFVYGRETLSTFRPLWRGFELFGMHVSRIE